MRGLLVAGNDEEAEEGLVTRAAAEGEPVGFRPWRGAPARALALSAVGAAVCGGAALWQQGWGSTSASAAAALVAEVGLSADAWTCATGVDARACESTTVGRLEFKPARLGVACGDCACCTRVATGHVPQRQPEAPHPQPQMWQCYGYAPGQDDAWCAKEPVVAGIKYLFAQGNGTCGVCWCCQQRVDPTHRVSQAIAATTELSATPPEAWRCHNYASQQSDDWCRTEPTQGGLEFLFAQGDGTCGQCFCCSRAIRSKVALFGLDTRVSDPHLSLMGVPGRLANNIGAGRQWAGWITKTEALLERLKSLASTEPERIVIYSDTDVVYGGCSDEELLGRYRRISEGSGGAPVVTGADTVIWPGLPSGRVNELNELTAKRHAYVMRFSGLSPSSWDSYPPVSRTYRAVNAGFFMGPAKYLVEFLECVKSKGLSGGQFDDQRGANLCMLESPGLVTVDYTGTIVIDLYGMPQHVLSFVDGKVVNNLANVTQCFAHTNGKMAPQPFFWWGWAKQLTAKLGERDRPLGGGADHCVSKHAVAFLRAHTGAYLDAEWPRAQARWSDKGERQQWAIEREHGGVVRSGDAVFLRDYVGNFLRANGTDDLSEWHERGPWQRFIIEKASGDGQVCAGDAVFLKAHTGKYVDVDGTGVHARWPNQGSRQRFVVEV